jgi:hypothetical protein
MTKQYVRTYAKPVEQKEKGAQKEKNQKPVPRLSKKQRAIKEILKPFEGKTLVLDTETTTDEKQLLRFGFAMIHGMSGEEIHQRYTLGILKPEDADTLRTAGFFYNPDVLTEGEIALLKKYCERVQLSDLARRLGVECAPYDERYVKLFCLPVSRFVRYFYALQKKRDTYMVMGHNLPFDLSRLATDWTEARKTMSGGFTLKLCNCAYQQEKHCPNHPNIRIKHIGFAKHFIDRRPVGKNNKTQFFPVHFLDTMTLSASLLDKPYGLDSLGKTLLPDKPDRKGKKRVSKLRKRSRPEGIQAGSNLTIQDIIYGVQDVYSTYACYRELRKLYLMHDVETPIWNLYSSASVGKAHLKMFGVKPFLEAHPDFPPDVIGYSMIAYYGARNEIEVRLQPVEIMYFDFLSQYTTANALMKLQDILLAESVTVEDNTLEVQELLQQPTEELLHKLAEPDFWPMLRCLIKIRPDMDRLPFRGTYGSEGTNVAVPYVKNETTLWYTLADVIASKLLTNKTPIIERSLCIVPSDRQYPTHKRKLFGHEIDLTQQDLFTELINVRNDIKKQLKSTNLSEQEQTLLDSQQKALKLIASATSYGIMVQVDQDDDTKELHPVLYYDIHGQALQANVTRVEHPGKYFAGPIGTFIPAAGRLMLAIAERLGRDRGLAYAMMDTDSIAPVRPDSMARDDFRRRALEVAHYFDTLSPYKEARVILEVKDGNFDDHGQIVPLFFIGVSTKRYVMWQEDEHENIRMVKFSSHGLGGMYEPYANTASPFTDIPEPDKNVQELGGARWVYDLWYRVISGFRQNVDLDGVTPLRRNPKTDEPLFSVSWFPQLQIPRFHKLTLSTWYLYETYGQSKGIEDLRPFNFISILPSRIGNSAYSSTRLFSAVDDVDDLNKRSAFIQALKHCFYAPYASCPDALHGVRCLDAPYTNMLVPEWFYLFTVGESLVGHFTNKEHKALNGDRIGFMQPRTMIVRSENAIVYVGKELNEIQASMGDETDYLLGDFNAVEYGYSKKRIDWKERLEPYHIVDLIVATALPPRTIQDVKSGKHAPSSDTEKALNSGLKMIQEHKSFGDWKKRPLGELVNILEMDEKQVMRLLYGKQNMNRIQRRMLLHSMAIHESPEDEEIATDEENRRKLRKAVSDGSVKTIIQTYLQEYPRARIESVLPHVCTTHLDGNVLSRKEIQPIFEGVKAEMKPKKS